MLSRDIRQCLANPDVSQALLQSSRSKYRRLFTTRAVRDAAQSKHSETQPRVLSFRISLTLSVKSLIEPGPD
jgi:hypothetical protein